ncbi:MAG: TonB-dependent receptor [Bacteroidetes bacterium]|nr:MAG: TonB-dependent receptor [Bacteroidota bacterium]
MRKLIGFLVLFGMITMQALAQNRTVTGKVTDEKGAALPNASVSVKGTQIGTASGADGSFSLSVPTGAKTLIFTVVGFENLEMDISNSSMRVRMKSSDSKLDEVVVTGYQTVKKRDIAAAISRIGGDQIDNLPVANFAQAAQGRVAGVAISAANGVPGGSLSVVIRGVGSISAGTTPLYVVDGIQLNTGTGSINTQNNPLNFLNPNDIESIEILKDAAAASIYGAKAGNGVVLVTTKKGKSGKPKFTFNAYVGQTSPLRVLGVLNSQDWVRVRSEAVANATPRNSADQTRATVLGNLGLPSGTGQGKLDSLPTYDWQKETFGTGQVQNYDLAMSGGGTNLSYYVSASYSVQDAFIKPTNFVRSAILSKLSYKINDKITFDQNISLSAVNQNAPYSLGNTGFGNPAYSAGMILPINPFYTENGDFYGLPSSTTPMIGTFNHNVLAVGEYVKYNTRTRQVVASGTLTYKVNSNLTLRSLLGIDYRLTQDHRYQDPRVNDGFAVNGRLSTQSDWNTNFINTNTIAYKKKFGTAHDVDLLGGLEYRRDINEWFQADGQTFPTAELQYLNAAAVPVSVGGAWSGSSNFSQFAKAGYKYNNKYIFNYTVRRDGSSRFGPNNRYATFHSVQLAWNIKDESFLKNVRAITDLKIRYSYGQSGNDQIGNTLFPALYGPARVYGNQSALNPTQLPNPDLTWETRVENNLGLDLSLFNNRLSLTFDAYSRQNKDLLLSRPLYSTTGFSSITQNFGTVENRGLEFLLEGTPIDGKFKWKTSFNISFQQNRVLKLYDDLQFLPNDPSIRVGVPLGSLFLAEWAGVNPATGMGMWYDINGNLTYNPVAGDRKIIGSIFPKAFGGWTNAFSFKGFTLEGFFQYEYGRTRPDGQYQQMMRMGGATVNQLQSGFDERWQKPGDVASAPRPFNGLADFNSAGWGSGSRYLFKTDYIRLKQITLSYDAPASSLRKLKLEAVRFYVQGINLWTYTEWQGYDPEFTGDNFGIIPQSRNITGGVQVRF